MKVNPSILILVIPVVVVFGILGFGEFSGTSQATAISTATTNQFSGLTPEYSNNVSMDDENALNQNSSVDNSTPISVSWGRQAKAHLVHNQNYPEMLINQQVMCNFPTQSGISDGYAIVFTPSSDTLEIQYLPIRADMTPTSTNITTITSKGVYSINTDSNTLAGGPDNWIVMLNLTMKFQNKDRQLGMSYNPETDLWTTDWFDGCPPEIRFVP